MEKILNFKIDENLYKALKIRAITEDTNMKSYITELIIEALKKPSSK